MFDANTTMEKVPIYKVNLWFWFWSIYEAANLWSTLIAFYCHFLTPLDKSHIQSVDSKILKCALKVIKL